MFVQQQQYYAPQPTYYSMPAPTEPYYAMHAPTQPYYAMPAKHPQQIVLPANPPAYTSHPSPTLSSTFLVQDVNSSPPSSDCGSTSSFSLNSHGHPSPLSFSAATPPAQVVSPQNMPMFPAHLTYQNVVCSPGPVMIDPATLQSAWTMPQQNLQWQPVWVQSPVNQQQSQHIPPGFAQILEPTPSVEHSPPPQDTFFPDQVECRKATKSKPTQKSNRVRCKSCSASGSRMGPKDIPMEDIIEATRQIPEVLAELPEFFGEPQLNFEEFAHYAPIFRTSSLNGDVLYFKIPRTTKERELNIPRRLGELFNRTFGPEDAPQSKSFSRISPHNQLCDARCAIRNAIVKSMQETIFTGCRNMEEGNEIFNLIFRFAGVSMVKNITTNLPQVFTSVVEHSDAKRESQLNASESFECTGVVSLFNYHLFRRRINSIS